MVVVGAAPDPISVQTADLVFALSRGAHGAGERHGVAKLRVSGLRGVRVSGK